MFCCYYIIVFILTIYKKVHMCVYYFFIICFVSRKLFIYFLNVCVYEKSDMLLLFNSLSKIRSFSALLVVSIELTHSTIIGVIMRQRLTYILELATLMKYYRGDELTQHYRRGKFQPFIEWTIFISAFYAIS